MRSFLILATLALCALWSPSPAHAADTLTEKQALRELRLLERAFQDLHPGAQRYLSADGLALEFTAARAAVAGGATPVTMYLLASRLSAALRCGHTWTNPVNQSPAMQERLAALPALPFNPRLLGGRMLVVASATADIAVGSEVLAIDGRPIAQLIAAFMPYLRADGSNDGKRLSQLDATEDGGALDRLLPLLFPPSNGRYALRLRLANGDERSVSVPAMTATAKRVALQAAGVADPPEDWHLAIHGDEAVLTLPTFAFWNSNFDWKAFLAASFEQMAQRKVRHLILDLRRNEGGDSAIGRELLSYLIRAPYTVPAGRSEFAYERAPYDLARHLDTWDFSFFDRTGKVVKGPGRNWLAVAARAPVVIAPKDEGGFNGRTVLLTGPRMSSAGYLFARDAQASGAATLVGQATGGNLRGLNGGELAWITLPHSGVAVDIPLVATVFEGAADAGVTPDVVATPTLDDVAAGLDPEMAAARALLDTAGGAGH